jgi:hypothetical protein
MISTGVLTCQAQAQEIWFSPQAAVANSPLHRAADLMDMFKPDAPWQEAASHIKVFKLYASYIGHAPQDEINSIISDLNRRHMAIALEVGVINIGTIATHPACGGLGLVEGHGTPDWAMSVSRKVKEAGGVIQYIAMDEPLFYGHYYKGPPGHQPGCQSDIDQIANQIVAPLNVFIEQFPNIAIGDTEPTGIAERDNWKNDELEWTRAFLKVMGRPMAFVQMDIPFARPGEERFAVEFFRELENLKQQKLIGAIGVIYNGTPQDTDDDSWVRDAQEHIRLLEDKNGLRPDQVIIQSWTANPTHAMPDSSPSTLTGLVNFYAQRMKSASH